MPIQPATRDRTSPDFPHGTERGNSRGCTSTINDCPSDPTCAEAAVTEWHRRNEQKAHDEAGPEDGRKGFYVRRRLAVTLTKTTVADLAGETGLSQDQITAVAEGSNIWLPERLAAPLDRAWALHYYGIDVDLLAPEAHGKSTTYSWGCRCRPCQRGQNNAKKRQELGIATHATVLPVTPAMQKHLAGLVEAAGSAHALSDVIGIHRDALTRIRRGEGGVQRKVAARLAAHTRATITSALNENTLVSLAPTVDRLGKLGAMGYPAKWVLRRAGANKEYMLRPGALWITRRLEKGIEAEFNALAHVPATPEALGVGKQHISRAKNNAARNGYHPALHYDDQGNLDTRSVPGSPWATADDKAAATLDALFMRTRGELSIRAIAEKIGGNVKNFERTCRILGLRSMPSEARYEVPPLTPESRPVAERIKALYWQYDDGQIGPVTAILSLGLTTTMTLGNGSGAIPLDHPEYVAFHAQVAEVAA
jgi:hypothetical protein